MDQKLGIGNVERFQRPDVNGTEQLGRIIRELRDRVLVHPVHPVQEMETPLDGALQFARLGIPELPVKRGDSCVITPVITVLVVPGHLQSCLWIIGVRFLGERPTRHKIIHQAVSAEAGWAIYGLHGRLDIVRVQLQGIGFLGLQGRFTVFDVVVQRRVEDVLELLHVTLVDHHPGRIPRKLRRPVFIRIKRIPYVLFSEISRDRQTQGTQRHNSEILDILEHDN